MPDSCHRAEEHLIQRLYDVRRRHTSYVGRDHPIPFPAEHTRIYTQKWHELTAPIQAGFHELWGTKFEVLLSSNTFIAPSPHRIVAVLG